MTIETLRELDLHGISDIDGGRISEAFRQALERVLADLDYLPGVPKPREIVLRCLFVPLLEGQCLDHAKVQFIVSDNVPKRESRVMDCSVRKRHGKIKLLFRPDSEDNVDQIGLPFDKE